MKIGDMISTLNEAELIQEYLEDLIENASENELELEFQCISMTKARAADTANVIGKLVRFIKDCEM